MEEDRDSVLGEAAVAPGIGLDQLNSAIGFFGNPPEKPVAPEVEFSHNGR